MTDDALPMHVRTSGAPIVPQHPTTFALHGQTRIDCYDWLRDKRNPDVIAHLEKENAYTAAVMASTQALQSTLYDEMLGRIKQTDSSVPYRRGAYEYYARMEAGRQYAIYCRRATSAGDASAAPETILLDLNVLGAAHAFIALGEAAVSDDGNLLAYSLDTTGYRQYTLYVKDLRDDSLVGEPIERVDFVVWAADNRTLVYATGDAVTKRTDTIWRRAIDANVSERLFEETDDIFDADVTRTRDGSTIVITSTAKDTSECRYLRADRPDAVPVVFAPRRDGVRYALDVRDGWFYVRTNEACADYELFATPVATPQRSAWTRVVAGRSGITLTGFESFKAFGVVTGRRDGLPSIEILAYDSHALTPLPFEEADYDIELGDNREFDTRDLRFTYESLVTPRSTYDLDVATGTRTLRKQVDVPGYDPQGYIVERRFETASDGMSIPVSLARKKDVPLDGSAPMLLYAYGSYGISIDAGFSATRLALLDRGVIYAIAHVRGGGEYGETWRTAGNLMHKRTTFTDFIDCAAGLIAANYTSVSKLVVQGASAGGLLMGAVANMRPDIFAGVIAKVPFVDVLTTMLDATLPLTTGEYREWGNPLDAPAYDYIATYSPLDNVRAQAYPAMLIEVSLNDSQVPYWEGAKFAAKVRAHTTGAAPILLQTNLHAGHGGSSGRYDKLREIAFEYAFVLDRTGITT